MRGSSSCAGVRVADACRAGDAAGRQHQLLSLAWWSAARSTSSGVSISDWISISPSRQSSNSSWRMNLSERIVGASVIGLVLLRWYVYARDLARDQHAVDADQLLDRELGRLGLGHGVDEGDQLVVRRAR